MSAKNWRDVRRDPGDQARADLQAELENWPPIWDAMVAEFGNPEDIDPTPTLEELLARRPRQ